MSKNLKNPLLLLDNDNLVNVLGEGEFKFSNLSFEEAKAIIDMCDTEDIESCFSNQNIETVVYDYLDIEKRDFAIGNAGHMNVDQDAVVFKIYITPSETKPIIMTDEGVEAKKIQNVYVYCQHIVRIR